MQQSVRDAVRGVAEGTWGSFVNAPSVIEMRLGAVVGRTDATEVSAKPEASSLSHTASCRAQACASSICTSYGHRLRKKALSTAMPHSPGAHEPRGRSGYDA